MYIASLRVFNDEMMILDITFSATLQWFMSAMLQSEATASLSTCLYSSSANNVQNY